MTEACFPNPLLLKKKRTKLTIPLIPELKKFRKLVDEALEFYFPPPETYAHRVRKAMEYSLLAGGKRIRPILCLWACRAVGGRVTRALPAACALEYIHTYSLIHDDLPALDNDDYRRGRLSCHKKFGEAMAILAGDALLSEAFSLLSHKGVMKKISDPIRLEIIREVARASGIQGMIAGQETDLEAERKKVSLAYLEYIHRHKTGTLIIASLVCGGLVGGGTAGELRALRKFGEKIGLLFQIKDDLLNVEGQARGHGKRNRDGCKKGQGYLSGTSGSGTIQDLGPKIIG